MMEVITVLSQVVVLVLVPVPVLEMEARSITVDTIMILSLIMMLMIMFQQIIVEAMADKLVVATPTPMLEVLAMKIHSLL